MKTKIISPFRPALIKDYYPKDLKIYTFNAGFKKKNDDLLIIVFNNLVPVSAVYSKTSTPSAPIMWDKKNNKGYCKILIVNSGNANAHTGSKGIEAIEKYVKAACIFFNCKKSEILVSSTGVIGENLKAEKIIKKINIDKEKFIAGILKAAKAISTTDTFPKTAITSIKYNSKKIKIYGFAKGSGMIAPNMGTMLAYIFIETKINKNHLNNLLKKYIESTFNAISVDGDTSTSDTVILFSTGVESKKIKITKTLLTNISLGLKKIMHSLSKQIVSDGEGISKLIEIKIVNAKTKNQANRVAFSIADSLLVKTAIAGEDANWGRIVMAIGKADKKIIQQKIIIKFDNLIVAKQGKQYSRINLKKLDKYMKSKVIKINVDLGIGKYAKTVWSSDLTHQYLKINSDYRS